MTVHDVPKWLAQLLGEDHPAIKEWEEYMRDLHDPDDPRPIWGDSPELVMAEVALTFIKTLPQKAQAVMAQEVINRLLGLDHEVFLERHHLVHPDKETA